jgi:hypothetical protein
MKILGFKFNKIGYLGQNHLCIYLKTPNFHQTTLGGGGGGAAVEK